MQWHRDQCEGFPWDKISELIFFLRNPSHKPLKRSFSVYSVPLATLSPVERERARDILNILSILSKILVRWVCASLWLITLRELTV